MDTAIDRQTDLQLPDPLIGTMLPRQFRIMSKLGKGAMSVVYTGLYVPFNQQVAIKLLRSHLISDQSTFKRFQQEAKTAGALEHPNIVGVLDFGVTDQGVPYLIMEKVNGHSLLQRLRLGPPLDLAGILNIFSQIADGLLYTHERGVVHRDVKPSNILIVTEDGHDVVKIVDFGIAKLQTMDGMDGGANLTATGEVFGTPLYVSPEQALGRAIDARADIYSFGCVLYEALAGRPAFSAPTAFDVLRLQITADAIPLDAARPDLKLPPTLLQVVERCMIKNPDERYQSFAEIIADLHKAVDEDKAGTYGRKVTKAASPVIKTTAPGTKSATRGQSGQEPAVAAPPNTVPKKKKMSLPMMLFLSVWISGCLTGTLFLFCLDFTDKFELASSQTEQMVTEPAAKQTAPAAGALASGKSKEVAYAAGLLKTVSAEIEHQEYSEALQRLLPELPKLQRGGAEQKDNLANAMNLIGISYYYMRDPVKASPYLAKAYDLDVQLYGSQSAACAGVLTNLGRVSEMLHKFDKAEKFYRDSLAISYRIYAPNDHKLANRIINLAAFLRRRHKSVEAATLERRAHDILGGT